MFIVIGATVVPDTKRFPLVSSCLVLFCTVDPFTNKLPTDVKLRVTGYTDSVTITKLPEVGSTHCTWY